MTSLQTQNQIPAHIKALLPEYKLCALDQVFYRDLVNHWSMFGSPSLVQKRGRGWVTNFRDHGHPTIWKTKTKAMEMAGAWVLEVAAQRLHLEEAA